MLIRGFTVKQGWFVDIDRYGFTTLCVNSCCSFGVEDCDDLESKSLNLKENSKSWWILSLKTAKFAIIESQRFTKNTLKKLMKTNRKNHPPPVPTPWQVSEPLFVRLSSFQAGWMDGGLRLPPNGKSRFSWRVGSDAFLFFDMFFLGTWYFWPITIWWK